MPGFFFFLFFCLLAIVLIASAVGFSWLETQRKKQVKGMLRVMKGETSSEPAAHILLDPENDSAISKLIAETGFQSSLELAVQQAGLTWGLPELLIGSLVAAAAGFLLGWSSNLLIIRPVSAIVFAALLGSLPFVYVRWKRRQRLAAFEEQFPEALDFLARSMRAGHAFSVSLEMLGAESPEPLGMEFRALFNEQNLGAPLEVAFANMAKRLPLVDVRFFISSVMLQKQTGGNLGEILVRLSYVIRERFRLKGQVKAASAHGRLTAAVLTIMPIALMIALLIIAPGYLQGLAADPDGKYIIIAAVIAQVLGYYFIRKIINIKV
jgi:tight adherence protein B